MKTLLSSFAARRSLLLAVVLAPSMALALGGCPADDELTAEEAAEATQEISDASQASSIAEGTVELTTSFTLGGAAADAAEEIRAFVVSQLPCAMVERQDNTVTITYGANPGNCTFHGQTFSGSHTVTVERTDENDVLVHHTWDQLSNGRVEVSGTADVTWDLDAKSRHVVHELEWTHLESGRMGVGSGDRVQTAIDGAWVNGININGERDWTGQRGTWHLDIDDVDWRWQDPVPEDGTYSLDTPASKHVTMTFERVDESTILVLVSGPRRDYRFRVKSSGAVESE
ncbi:MAG: hypothetical protein U0271_22380 [Polyangiaceae bacterium]